MSADDQRPVDEPTRTTRSDSWSIWIFVLALLAISVVSRLPQLLSPNLLLDGDECILGLMAKHLAEGRELPIFFYGQHYGLSSVEAAAAAFMFVIFGTGPLPLKLAMLALWTAGVLATFLALTSLLGKTRSFWVAALFVLNPAWAVWSMKARGGYLTSFAATAALLYLLVQDAERRVLLRWLSAGALTVIIYLAQPLWLPGVLPITLWFLWSSHRPALNAAVYLIAPAFTLSLIAVVPATTVGDIWIAPSLGNHDLIGSLPRVMEQIYVNLTGSYYLWFALEPPGPSARALALIWGTMLPAAVLLQAYRLLARQWLLWSHLLFVAVWSTILANWLLVEARDARYLLPLSSLLVLLAGVEIFDLVDRHRLTRRFAFTLIIGMLVLGSLSILEFRTFSYLWKNPEGSMSESRRMRRVFSYLNAKGVRHVFSMNGLLQWQIMFYSNETVLARWTPWTDRYPAYVEAVNRALARGEPIGIVGYTTATAGLETMVANPEAIFKVDDKYFVYAGADRALLQKLEFALPE